MPWWIGWKKLISPFGKNRECNYCFVVVIVGLFGFFGGRGLIEKTLIIMLCWTPWHLLSCRTTELFSCWLTASPFSSELCSCWFTSNSIPAISWWLSLLSHFIMRLILEINVAPCSYIIQPICQLKNSTFNVWTWIIYQPKVQSCKHTVVSLCCLYSWPHKLIRVFALAWTRWDPELAK